MHHAIVVYDCPTNINYWNPGPKFREKFLPGFKKFCRLESVEEIQSGMVYLTSANKAESEDQTKKREACFFIVAASFQEVVEGKMPPRWVGAADPQNSTEIHSLRPKGETSDMDFPLPTGSKDTNPKDAVGVRKWRQFTSVSMLVLAEVGAGMLEGARKYGRHNYRVAGVRASVYVDAAMGHVMQWWEGEDIDADSGLSHITKAICSLFVLRDAMIQNMLTDDRPPKGDLDQVRKELQAAIEGMFERHPDPVPAYTAVGESSKK